MGVGLEKLFSRGVSQFFFVRACAYRVVSVVTLLALFSNLIFASSDSLQNLIALLQSKVPSDKIDAVQSLKTIRQPEVAQALSAALANESDPVVQMALLDGVAAMQELARPEPVAALLHSTVAPIRKRAAYTLGFIGGRKAERALAQALLRESDAGVKGMLLQSLSVCASSESVPAIQNAMKDSRPEVQAKAAEALSYAPGHRMKRPAGRQGGVKKAK